MTRANCYEKVLGHADHESGLIFTITKKKNYFIFCPENSTIIEVEHYYSSFYYVNITPTGKMPRFKVMYLVVLYRLLSSVIQ